MNMSEISLCDYCGKRATYPNAIAVNDKTFHRECHKLISGKNYKGEKYSPKSIIHPKKPSLKKGLMQLVITIIFLTILLASMFIFLLVLNNGCKEVLAFPAVILMVISGTIIYFTLKSK